MHRPLRWVAGPEAQTSLASGQNNSIEAAAYGKGPLSNTRKCRHVGTAFRGPRPEGRFVGKEQSSTESTSAPSSNFSVSISHGNQNSLCSSKVIRWLKALIINNSHYNVRRNSPRLQSTADGNMPRHLSNSRANGYQAL